MKKATACMAITSLAASLFVSSVTLAMPTQGGLTASAKSASETDFRARADSDKLTRSSMSSRPAPEKPETAATGKSAKTEDKKTISRCWKRLMNMVREVNHAHKSRTK